MDSTSRDMVLLILQFLGEEKKYKETARMLEQQSRLYFNMEYFEGEILEGNWDEAEKYLSAFTKVDDNPYSMKIFFEIRKHKYFEALDVHDWTKARNILDADLEIFASFNEELYMKLASLLTLKNFRHHRELSKSGDTMSMRKEMVGELKKLFEKNRTFRDKLKFPTLDNSRLITIVNQSLNWQHYLCQSPKPDKPADIKTIFVDHTCGQTTPTPDGASQPAPIPEDPTPFDRFLASSPYSEPASIRAKTAVNSDQQVPVSGPSNTDQQLQNLQS